MVLFRCYFSLLNLMNTNISENLKLYNEGILNEEENRKFLAIGLKVSLQDKFNKVA